MFDILAFYQDHKVDYYLSGKNVVEGWVNICCPFCDDKSNHLGVCINNPKAIKCWRCGNHALPELLAQFGTGKTFYALCRIYDKEEGEVEEIVEPKKAESQLAIDEATELFFENSSPNWWIGSTYRKYLEQRKFSPDKLETNWGVRPGIETGEYRYRLMIPIYTNGQLVSFQGRDVTGKQEDKYKNCEGTNIHDYLYGLNEVLSDRVIITEGVTDVWRLGKGNAIATFGIQYVSKQVKLLVEKGIKHAVVFFDREPQAQIQAKHLIADLELFDIKCINFEVDGDPASLTKEEAEKVVKLLLSY